MTWRIATRRSTLARIQAAQVGEALSSLSGRGAELVPLSSTGDDHPERAVEAFDAKGIFVDRIRAAVLAGDCHLAVHSYKDLPTAPADGLVVPVVPRRVDPRDALVTRAGWRLVDLPRDRTVTIGTSSARRRAQLQRARRDLLVQPLRGNVETRLRRVADGDLGGVVVALAGLLRLGPSLGDLLDHVGVVPLEHGEVLHAPAQGALALECRTDDLETQTALRLLDHRESRLAVRAERGLLAALEGGCTAPIGAHAEVLHHRATPQVELLGLLSDAGGTNLARVSERGAVTELEQLTAAVASSLLAATGRGSGTPVVGEAVGDE